MKLLHLSDIHLSLNGQIIWGTDTKKIFDMAIEKICSMDGIDAIVVSGDLSNDGSEWTYKYIDSKFASLGIPTYCCPGNHDNVEVMYRQLQFCQTANCVDICGWRFYLLNSVIADDIHPEQNRARGMISKKRINCIRRIFRA